MVSVLEPGGAAYVFHADTEGLNFRRAFVDAGLHLAGCCIWVKNSLVLGRSDYQWQHEPVFSNIEQQSLEFVKYTLDPWVSRWEQNMMRSLLTDDEKTTYFIKFNVDGLLRGDYQSRMNGYAIGRQNGWMSANDIRELENLDRIPEELGGDLYLINGNMTKLQDAGIFAEKGKEKDSDEEVLGVEEPDEGQSGGENHLFKRNDRRGELV